MAEKIKRWWREFQVGTRNQADPGDCASGHCNIAYESLSAVIKLACYCSSSGLLSSFVTIQFLPCHHTPSFASHCVIMQLGGAECLSAYCWTQATKLADAQSFLKWLSEYGIISNVLLRGILKISLFPSAYPQESLYSLHYIFLFTHNEALL